MSVGRTHSVVVSVPVRFAGGIDAEPALEVMRAEGWTVVADPAANVHASHPGGLVYAGWLPASGVWTWRIRCTDDLRTSVVWTADFSDAVPIAAVAAYLGALAVGLGNGRGPCVPDTGPGGPCCPDVATAHARLAVDGWEIQHRDSQYVEARHGDGDLLVAHGILAPKWHIPWMLRVGSGWAVTCTLGRDGPEVWRAVFDGDAPMTAVAAFLAAVTAPEPVACYADNLRSDVLVRHLERTDLRHGRPVTGPAEWIPS